MRKRLASLTGCMVLCAFSRDPDHAGDGRTAFQRGRKNHASRRRHARPTTPPLRLQIYRSVFRDPYDALARAWYTQMQQDGQTAFGERIDTALGAREATARAEKYRETDGLLAEKHHAVFLYHETALELCKPWVRGYTVRPEGLTGVADWTALYIVSGQKL